MRYAYSIYIIVPAVRIRLPAKAASNVKKHGVSFADAEALFEDSLAVHRVDPDA